MSTTQANVEIAGLSLGLLTDAIICKDLAGNIARWDHNAERIFGFRREEVIGRNIDTIIPLERRAEEVMILERLNSGENIEGLETIRRRKDGSLRRVVLCITPIRDEEGRVVAGVKFARDITLSMSEPDAMLALRAREAEHRAKNILATMMALTRLSEGNTVEELKDVISGRIRALADVTSLQGVIEGKGADLRKVITNELWSTNNDVMARVSLEGLAVSLSADEAPGVAMIVHELVTNSIKYGALSHPLGRLAVEWTLHESNLELHWTESGMSNMLPPTREGFGSRLIKSVAAGTLKGRSYFVWSSPAGLKFKLAFAHSNDGSGDGEARRAN